MGFKGLKEFINIINIYCVIIINDIIIELN